MAHPFSPPPEEGAYTEDPATEPPSPLLRAEQCSRQVIQWSGYPSIQSTGSDWISLCFLTRMNWNRNFGYRCLQDLWIQRLFSDSTGLKPEWNGVMTNRGALGHVAEWESYSGDFGAERSDQTTGWRYTFDKIYLKDLKNGWKLWHHPKESPNELPRGKTLLWITYLPNPHTRTYRTCADDVRNS